MTARTLASYVGFGLWLLVGLVGAAACGGSEAADAGLRLDGMAWEMVFGADTASPDADVVDAKEALPGEPDPEVAPPDAVSPDAAEPEALPEGGGETGAEPSAEAAEPAPEPAAEIVEPVPDVAPDAAPDTAPDVAPDTAPDLPVDAAPEVVPCPAGCDDAQPCTLDQCQPNGTCSHTALSNGAPCEDGDTCTTGDTCQSGLCFAGALLGCADGDPCSTDACQPGVGCTHAPATGPACDDGDPCTGGDRCETGKCQAGGTNLCPTCADGACEPPVETCSSCPADCGPCNETACSGGVDEDGDGQTDCDDDDCSGDAACPVTCAVDADLSCGKSEYDTAFGDDLSGYSCGSEDGSGSEGIYRFVSAAGGYVTVWVTAQNDNDRYDVYLLSGSCSPSACTDFEESVWSDKSVSFSAAAGVPYYVVVERVSGAGSQYIVKPTCY